jgi:hypothetical protein
MDWGDLGESVGDNANYVTASLLLPLTLILKHKLVMEPTDRPCVRLCRIPLSTSRLATLPPRVSPG